MVTEQLVANLQRKSNQNILNSLLEFASSQKTSLHRFAIHVVIYKFKSDLTQRLDALQRFSFVLKLS